MHSRQPAKHGVTLGAGAAAGRSLAGSCVAWTASGRAKRGPRGSRRSRRQLWQRHSPASQEGKMRSESRGAGSGKFSGRSGPCGPRGDGCFSAHCMMLSERPSRALCSKDAHVGEAIQRESDATHRDVIETGAKGALPSARSIRLAQSPRYLPRHASADERPPPGGVDAHGEPGTRGMAQAAGPGASARIAVTDVAGMMPLERYRQRPLCCCCCHRSCARATSSRALPRRSCSGWGPEGGRGGPGNSVSTTTCASSNATCTAPRALLNGPVFATSPTAAFAARTRPETTDIRRAPVMQVDKARFAIDRMLSCTRLALCLHSAWL